MSESLHFPNPFPPSFASAWGDDVHGLWADLELVSNSPGNSLVQRMRWIEPGSFLMGSPENEPGRFPNEGPQHGATLAAGYWLADTACTVAIWSHVRRVAVTAFEHQTLPVQSVNWLEVQEFLRALPAAHPDCEALLPTEAQWEYACRAGTTTAFNCGDRITSQRANFDPRVTNSARASPGEPAPVKSLPPNAWGLYEMHGNIWEWCADGLRRYTATTVIDPTGPMDDLSTPRVVRGGSFVREARHLRCAVRVANPPDLRRRGIGFRFILRPRP